MELENTGEQTQETETPEEGANNPESGEPQKVKLTDGTEVTLEELKSGYLRQSDYTKKTQELSEKKKTLDVSDEDLAAMKKLKENGFATKEDIDRLKAEQEDTKAFDDFKTEVPTLTDGQLKTLEALKKVDPTKDYITLAKDFGILNDVQLSKAKGITQIKGETLGLPKKEKQENVLDRPGIRKNGLVSDAEYKRKMESVGLST